MKLIGVLPLASGRKAENIISPVHSDVSLQLQGVTTGGNEWLCTVKHNSYYQNGASLCNIMLGNAVFFGFSGELD